MKPKHPLATVQRSLPFPEAVADHPGLFLFTFISLSALLFLFHLLTEMTGCPSFIPSVLGSYLGETQCWAPGQVQDAQAWETAMEQSAKPEGENAGGLPGGGGTQMVC